MSNLPDKETVAAAAGALATLLFAWGKLRDVFPDSRASRVEAKLDRVLERQDDFDDRLRKVEVSTAVIADRTKSPGE